MNVLVVNAGSSSLKLRLLDADDKVVAQQDVTGREGGFAAGEVTDAVLGMASAVSEVDAVGHRVVHGGTRYSKAVLIDPAVRADLGELVPLAPLHQPTGLAGIDAVSRALPDTPAVGCFDTAFHSTLSEAAAVYAVPAEWRKQYSLRRYGFHGLSHAYVSRRAAEMLGRDVAGFRVVTCHLGAGASLAAVDSGRSVDTTMGFTPLEGLIMATRSGSIDPGIVTWLQQQAGMSAAEVSDGLEHHSGMLGLAGTADMREVENRRDAGDADAALAFDAYLHQLRRLIGSMVAVLGGLDALVFTGGIGENSAAVRGGAVAGLGFLGVALNSGVNAATRGEGDISAPGAPVSTLVVAAREDVEIARQVRQLIGNRKPA